jgi:hypothetical protein
VLTWSGNHTQSRFWWICTAQRLSAQCAKWAKRSAPAETLSLVTYTQAYTSLVLADSVLATSFPKGTQQQQQQQQQ